MCTLNKDGCQTSHVPFHMGEFLGIFLCIVDVMYYTYLKVVILNSFNQDYHLWKSLTFFVYLIMIVTHDTCLLRA